MMNKLRIPTVCSKILHVETFAFCEVTFSDVKVQCNGRPLTPLKVPDSTRQAETTNRYSVSFSSPIRQFP